MQFPTIGQCAFRLALPVAHLQQSSYPCQEIGHAKRLRHKVVNAGVQRLRPSFREGGPHDDEAPAGFLLRPQFQGRRYAVQFGHARVENHKVRSIPRRELYHLSAVGRGHDLVALT